MKKLLALLMLLPVLAFGQDITNRWFTYSPMYYLPGLPDPYTIEALTDDTADTSGMCIGGGGDVLATRGGSVCAYGNENAQHGNLLVSAGSDVSGGAIKFSTGALVHLTIPDSITAAAALVFGISTDTTPGLTVRSAKADGADDAILDLTAGGAYGASRGAAVEMLGDDYGGAGAGGTLNLSAGIGTAGAINFSTGNIQHLQIPQSISASTALVYGLSTDSSPQLTIRSAKADAADDAELDITAGGAAGQTRGAGITLLGNDYGGASAGGTLTLNAGGGTLGNIVFNTESAANTVTTKWTMGAAAATVSDLIFGESGTASSAGTIRGARADGSDDGILQLTGGGASVVAGSRGAYIQLQGEDYGGVNKGGNINIIGGVGNANTAGNYPTVTIRNDTVDGSDWGMVKIGAGGDVTTSRGAIMLLYGEQQAAGAGGAYIQGSSTAGDIGFSTHGSTRFTMLNNASASVTDLAYGNNTYNAIVTTIRAATDDGTDDSTLQLTAGGSSTLSGGRGAYISLQGEDVSALNRGGSINIVGGVGASTTYFPTITIRNDTVDGSDWGAIKLAAGGAVDSATRGAYISLYGNENASTGAELGSGGAAGNAFNLINGSDTGEIRFYTGLAGNSTSRWIVKGAADTTTDALVFGKSTVASSNAIIRGARADASDDGALDITAGGACATTRGSCISLKGDDYGGAGAGGGIILDTGTGTTQTLVIKTAGTTALTINTDGTLDSNVTDIGWRVATGANTACTSTCGANKGCVFGQDTDGATHPIVACTDNTADRCICTTT